jgi:hypothetical protein
MYRPIDVEPIDVEMSAKLPIAPPMTAIPAKAHG